MIELRVTSTPAPYREDVAIGGEVVGYVMNGSAPASASPKVRAAHAYAVVIHLGPVPGDASVIGHGPSPSAAIVQALTRGRADVARWAARLEQIAAAAGGGLS